MLTASQTPHSYKFTFNVAFNSGNNPRTTGNDKVTRLTEVLFASTKHMTFI